MNLLDTSRRLLARAALHHNAKASRELLIRGEALTRNNA